jgi:hypothetical protein
MPPGKIEIKAFDFLGAGVKETFRGMRGAPWSF